jgi:MFS-type transporter involved in bile tolerance (Atg22 family)
MEVLCTAAFLFHYKGRALIQKRYVCGCSAFDYVCSSNHNGRCKPLPKKVINGWAMYDWANSVYNLVITTTFFPIYFAAVTKAAYGENSVPFLGRTFKNSSLYDYSLAFAYLLIVLLAAGAFSIADSRGNKKSFMKFFCYLGAVSCSALFFFRRHSAQCSFGSGCFVLAAIGFVGSLVFYNSYLPEIAAPEDRDRVSAKGFPWAISAALSAGHRLCAGLVFQQPGR